MRAFLLCGVVLLLTSCQSLPAQIAERAANTSNNCYVAAEKTQKALEALGYEVYLCTGEVYPGSKYHAWVEIDNFIIDPYAILGQIEINRDDLDPGEYKIDVKITLFPL